VTGLVQAFAQHVGVFFDVARESAHLGYGVDTDQLMLAEFLGAVRYGRRLQPDGLAGIATLRIVLAAQESARTGRVVDVVFGG